MAEQERGGIFARLAEAFNFGRRKDEQIAEMEAEREKRATELMEEIKGLKPRIQELMQEFNELEDHSYCHLYVNHLEPSVGFVDETGLLRGNAKFIAVRFEAESWKHGELLCADGNKFEIATFDGNKKALENPTQYIDHMEAFLDGFGAFEEKCHINIHKAAEKLKHQAENEWTSVDDLLANATSRSEAENAAKNATRDKTYRNGIGLTNRHNPNVAPLEFDWR